MKNNRIVLSVLIILIAFLGINLMGCGSGGSTDSDSDETESPAEASVTPAAVNVTASRDSVNPGDPGETTSITATVYDVSGWTISGVNVLFTLDDPTLAYITSSATTSGSGEASCDTHGKEFGR